MDQTSVTLINQLTLAAAAIIACGVLWRAYSRRVEDHINDLRQENLKQRDLFNQQIGELRARLMVIEDALHIPRADRVKYLPNLEMPAKSEMKDLD